MSISSSISPYVRVLNRNLPRSIHTSVRITLLNFPTDTKIGIRAFLMPVSLLLHASYLLPHWVDSWLPQSQMLARVARWSGTALCRPQAVRQPLGRMVLGARSLSSLPPYTILPMPALSPTMTSGNLAAWKKAEGDKVDVDDVLAEVETDKATVDYESQDEGFIAKILVPEGCATPCVPSPESQCDACRQPSRVQSDRLGGGHADRGHGRRRSVDRGV